VIFEKEGPENTAKTIDLAIKRAMELGIGSIVAASNKGVTAEQLIPWVEEFEIIIVGQAFGSGREMEFDVRKKLESAGMKVLQATHALSGAERGLSTKFGGVYPVEIIANTLKMLGQGTKVCVEIATMAYDAGLVADDQDIIAIGGTGRGADTAMVIRPAHASSILETKVREIICKPR